MSREYSAAIERSRKSGGICVTLDRFTYEDEVALADAAIEWHWYEETEDGIDRALYCGPDWRVELVGTGDRPRAPGRRNSGLLRALAYAWALNQKEDRT